MKTLKNLTILGLLAVFSAFAQQNTILQTSLSAAVSATATQFRVAAATGINGQTVSVPGSSLWIADIGQTMGELVQVQSVSGTTVNVARFQGRATAHASGAMVLVATVPNWFATVDPQGSCVTARTFATPYLNTSNGNQWLCSTKTLTWTPSWGTPAAGQALSATATASVAGATAIAGPFVEISGTNAITSFTMSTGWNGQSFCTYPTAAWTITATNNIAKAATAVADRALCFTYNANSSKFSPQY